MKINAKDILKPASTLFIICLVVTLLLSLTNLITYKKIEQINKETTEASLKVVLPGASSFADSADKTCSIGKNGTDTVGYVFTAKAKSYGGDLNVMTGIDTSGKVTGTVILSINDTPGLGLNAQKESFRDQFKQAVPQKGFEVIKSGSAGDGQIEAMTGATITSNAVADCVNQAVASYQKIVKNGVKILTEDTDTPLKGDE